MAQYKAIIGPRVSVSLIWVGSYLKRLKHPTGKVFISCRCVLERKMLGIGLFRHLFGNNRASVGSLPPRLPGTPLASDLGLGRQGGIGSFNLPLRLHLGPNLREPRGCWPSATPALPGWWGVVEQVRQLSVKVPSTSFPSSSSFI